MSILLANSSAEGLPVEEPPGVGWRPTSLRGETRMSLHPEPIGPVPEETARVARAAFRRGNPYLKLRDVLGNVYADDDFADLFPRRGQTAEAPWRLALVTVLQFAEGL